MRREAGFITRVVCTPDGVKREPGMCIVNKETYPEVLCIQGQETERLTFEKDGKELLSQVGYAFETREIFKYEIEGGKAKIVTRKTIDGERSFVENASTVKTGEAFSAAITFEITSDEAIYGLGQQENGVFNYRNVKEYLYQNNMKIPMPVLLSSKGYAILFDAGCLMTYEEKDNRMTVTFDAVDQIAYYLITGANFDELIHGIRTLTGKAVMLPRWAFGYVQSKERYVSQEDILQTAGEFQKREIPVSCLVLDWQSWESGKWGNKIVDKERFPDLKGMTDALHAEDIAFMISIWPNMNKGCENNQEMMEAGTLLANLSTYDAFNEKGRDLYWKQCERELVAGGCDAWWCDSTEPFTPDWNGLEKRAEEDRYELAKENLTRYFDARIANNYALAHAKGIYENQTAASREKRVVNLTRSGSLSIQQYGVVLWSGDIMATWEVFRQQVAEGQSMCMAGIPYWTLDIGAFFTGHTQGYRRMSGNPNAESPWFWRGLFERGTADQGYRELYTRWLQFGTYLPVMRSHGTDTPREPWNFGEKGTVYYDTIVNYIQKRYQMLPYTYSLARKVETEDYTILRSLMFDFAADANVKELSGEFLYGPSYLVCPVTEAMEYGPEDTYLGKPQTWTVYLPKGADWYQENTKMYFQGGQYVTVDAPISWQPVFVRAGAILPLSMAGEKSGTADTLEVYEGADGAFACYFDNGKDYAYQDGEYAAVPVRYDDGKKELVIGAAEGKYSYPTHYLVKFFRKDGSEKTVEVDYEGREVTLSLN
ncbi:MAG: glycoside hydrolase family 31 protein [Eubacteriales bacterium]|nr:glycoside hydrolase family 31 protein [Eubacteriales bacterium]